MQNTKALSICVFGGCTTLVNIVPYFLCTRLFSFGTIISNVIAWILVVTFANETNRSLVFESQSKYSGSVVKTKILDFYIELIC